MRHVLALAVVGLISVGTIASADDAKPIRFSWFVDFSPDGKFVVAPYGGWEFDEGGEVRVWDVETGEAKFVIPSPRGVRASAWSPKGSFFASGNYGGDVRLYDSGSGKTILEASTLNTPGRGGSVELVQITPDEQSVVVATGMGVTWVFDAVSGEVIRGLTGHTDAIWGMRLAPDGKTLATAGKDHTVRLWNIETGEQLSVLSHPSVTNGVAFTSNSASLATGCWDRTIRIWDVDSGKLQHSVVGHKAAICDFDYSTDDKMLASSSTDRTVKVWDTDSGKLLGTLSGHEQPVYGVRFSPDGKTIASGSWDGTVRLWDVEQMKEKKTLRRKLPTEKGAP